MTALSSRPRVLITRPAAQTRHFREQCEAAGFATLSLPCIDIEFLDAPLELADLQQSGKVLFTSANAVSAAHRQLPFPWNDVAVCAIGPATERALAGLGQSVCAQATAPYNSEAFLASLREHGMPECLTIIKGEGGRGWLIDELQSEGVRVTTKALYRRALPRIDETDVQCVLDGQAIDIISVTSDEVLKNFMLIAGDARRDKILQLPLVCNSQRCAELAAALGFATPARVTSEPGDTGQLAQLRDWLQQRLTET